jgi:uncharacterized cupredoxin-like copper-binding protein
MAAVIRTVMRPCVAACVFAAATTGCGTTPAANTARAEIVVVMSEWSFESSSSTFTAGVPYRFQLRNAGAGEHEWAVVPGGATDERGALIEVEEDWLPPGATILRTVTFPGPGRYDFVCFLPGHLEAGMRLPVNVLAR